MATENDDWVGEVNASFPAASSKAQTVDAHVCGKHLADSISIAGIGERRTENLLQVKLVLVELRLYVFQTGQIQQTRKFFERQGSNVGRIAQLFHAVECLGLLRARCEYINDNNPAAAGANPNHLRQDCPRVKQVME